MGDRRSRAGNNFLHPAFTSSGKNSPPLEEYRRSRGGGYGSPPAWGRAAQPEGVKGTSVCFWATLPTASGPPRPRRGTKKSFGYVFDSRMHHQKIQTKNLLGLIPPHGIRLHCRIGCAIAVVATGPVCPVLSRWVFNNDNGSSANCASNCANNCGNNVRNNADFRSTMFGSVAPLEGNNFVSKDKVWLTCRTKCIRHFSGIAQKTVSV